MTDEIKDMTEELTEEGDMEAVHEQEALEEAEAAQAETPEAELPPELNEAESIAAIEAILFSMGKSVDVERIAYALNISLEDTFRYLEILKEEYENQNRGIYINFLEDKVQLCTKKDYYPQLIRIATQPKKPALTPTVLETLSIVAYKQPVTKGDIERIRGVKSDFAVNKLVEYGLIEEVGRLEAPGRPILFATTEEFLRRFGMNSVGSLPQADPEQVETFTKEAMSEITV